MGLAILLGVLFFVGWSLWWQGRTFASAILRSFASRVNPSAFHLAVRLIGFILMITRYSLAGLSSFGMGHRIALSNSILAQNTSSEQMRIEDLAWT